METFFDLIGRGGDLTPVEMCIRAFIVFIIAVIFLRFAGRRAFGMGSPFDNVISILLGGILGRAVVGTSPFFATLAAALALVIMHRLFAWISLYYSNFGGLVKGNARIIYENGEINEKNMRLSLISMKDLMEGVRKEANVETLEEIEKIYVERDGKISVIKQKSK